MKKKANCVRTKTCCFCGKEPLSRNEIGLTRKLLDNESMRFYCLDCLASYLDIDAEFLRIKIEEFKEQGCKLF